MSEEWDDPVSIVGFLRTVSPGMAKRLVLERLSLTKEIETLRARVDEANAKSIKFSEDRNRLIIENQTLCERVKELEAQS